MSLSPQFLDEVRVRTSLSGLIGRSLKLTRAGREWKACCPFHTEDTPSFYVNDDKGFYHCFGCSAHGDAMRWLTDRKGMTFMEAVASLAAAAGLQMPERSPEAREATARRDAAIPLLEAAANWYADELRGNATAQAYLAARGVGAELIARFRLGWAPGGHRSVARATGGTPPELAEAGLMTEDNRGGYRDFLWKRLTIPIRDPRGRVVGFAARAIDDDMTPKYLNSRDGPSFDKGRILFNLDRAGEAGRKAKRLIVVEGQIDTIMLSGAGIDEAVAPMGTALTEAQMLLCWRVVPCPALLFDGDKAGHGAAVKAALRALPGIGPGRSFRIGILPAGQDPDSLVRMPESEGGGRDAIERIVTYARPMDEYLFDALVDQGDITIPEGRAAIWQVLADAASTIAHEETRGQYLGTWRARFDRRFPLVELAEDDDSGDARALRPFDVATMEHLAPDAAEKRLWAIARRMKALNEEARGIGEDKRELMKLAELSGFDPKALRALVKMIEDDEKHGSSVPREEFEARLALYREVMGVRGPMTAAMLPRAVDPRPQRKLSGGVKRVDTAMRLIAAAGYAEGAGA